MRSHRDGPRGFATVTLAVILLTSLAAAVLSTAPGAAAGSNTTVRIEQPSDGDVVNGTVDVTGSAYAPYGGIDQVDVRIDGGPWQQAHGTSSWSYKWDTKHVDNGNHSIEVVAIRGGKRAAHDEINVTVANGPEGPPPPPQPAGNQIPTVNVTAPTEGQTVSGTVKIQGNANDSDGQVRYVEVRVDGWDWTWATGTTNWTWWLDTTKLPDGPVKVRARAYDGTNYSHVRTVNITIQNGGGGSSHAPALTILSPKDGATVSSPLTVTGVVQGAASSANLSLRVDQGNWTHKTVQTGQRFTVTLDNLPSGPHTLVAQASDPGGTTPPTTLNIQVQSASSSPGGSGLGSALLILGVLAAVGGVIAWYRR